MVAAGAATAAMLAARDAVERVDEQLSTWIERTSSALPINPPPPARSKAWRAAASRRLGQVTRLASDLAGNTSQSVIERAVERIVVLVAAIEEQLDVICRETERAARVRSGWTSRP
jgi:hypothetical protein